MRCTPALVRIKILPMRCQSICTSYFLGMLALTGCHDQRAVSGADIKCRDRPAAVESRSESTGSPDGMSFAGFQLGESAYLVEDRISQHQNWVGVSLSDCGGAWGVRAGTTLREGSAAVCDVHGTSECELMDAWMQRTTSSPHVLTSMLYARRFQRGGRPTEEVVAELKADYGEPFWQNAIRRSRGWPDIGEETSFLWTRHADKSVRAVNAKLAQEVIEDLGACDYLLVTLLHKGDHTVTYAMTASLDWRPEQRDEK
jgi:hypothetical protein